MEEYRHYIELIKDALSQVEGEYFNLVTTYDGLGIVRERVFCYEFYHQMRLAMQGRYDISLNGEIDKRGHRDFQKGHQRNPDFVFHTPGTHGNNTIVMEVKGKLDDREGVLKDFETLSIFVNNYHYKFGIFVVYNHTIRQLRQILGASLPLMKQDPAANRILVLSLPSSLDECAEVVLLEL
jgi:hypothetical protein